MASRAFLLALAAMLAAPAHASPLPFPASAQWVTLGTGGGPLPRVRRAQPANALVVNGVIYLFDVGDGVLRQLALAGLGRARIAAVFISHHHFDHNAGLGPLLASRWLFNHYEPIPVTGPPGTRDMVKSLGAAFRATELAPITIGAPRKPSIAATVKAIDLPADTDDPVLVYADANVRVLAVTNDHYHFPRGSEEARFSRSYAFRVETAGRNFAYTGDTGPSRNVEQVAQNADLLISEVIDLGAMERVLRQAAEVTPALLGPMLAHMEQDHLTPEAVGDLATRAHVREVVLTHLAPGLDSDLDTSPLTEGVKHKFAGEIHVANDGDRF